MGDHGTGFFPGWPGANGKVPPEVADVPMPAPARSGSHPVPTGPPGEGAPEGEPGEARPGEEAPGVVIATSGTVPAVPGSPPRLPTVPVTVSVTAGTMPLVSPPTMPVTACR